MAKLLIKDLSASLDLDRQAMTAIIGGARVRSQFGVALQAQPTAARVVDYPPGFASARSPMIDERIPPQSLLRKF